MADTPDEVEMERKYWLDLFTGTTWSEFLDSGATVPDSEDIAQVRNDTES